MLHLLLISTTICSLFNNNTMIQHGVRYTGLQAITCTGDLINLMTFPATPNSAYYTGPNPGDVPINVPFIRGQARLPEHVLLVTIDGVDQQVTSTMMTSFIRFNDTSSIALTFNIPPYSTLKFLSPILNFDQRKSLYFHSNYSN